MKTTKYMVTFLLEVEGDIPADDIDDAITEVVDDEIQRAKRGVSNLECKFVDATFFEVRRGES